MTTVRHIERYWNEGRYSSLVQVLCAFRTDLSPALAQLTLGDGRPSVLAAALGVIRLAELNMTHCTIFQTLVDHLLVRQEGSESDVQRGWGDVPSTILATRALLAAGHLPAAAAGLAFLAEAQRSDGSLPRDLPKRLGGCAATTLLALKMLGARLLSDLPAFRLATAQHWLSEHLDQLPEDLRPAAKRSATTKAAQAQLAA